MPGNSASVSRKTSLSELARRTKEPPISWLMAAALDRPQLISLAVGFTDSASLPAAETREILGMLLKHKKRARHALQYGSTPGLPELRKLTAERISAQDQLERALRPENLVISSGSQQLLYLLTEALCDPGDIVLVEDPTYFVYLGILQSRGVRARGIRMEPNGIDLRHLEQVLGDLRKTGDLPRVKLLYLVSYFQNPTGRTTSYEKKTAALQLLQSAEQAARHPIYLLEDAAYRELRFAGEDVRSSLAAGRPERVLYTGTYSKPFATGARVGFGVLPEPVLGAVLRIKGNHDFGSSNLLSWMIAEAINQGIYDRHIAELRKRYRRKAALMETAITRFFPPARADWQTPGGGLYFWVKLAGKTRTGMRSNFFRKALSHEVLYVPGELCYAADPTRPKPVNELRISFGAAAEQDIRLGIQRIGQIL